jgi:hypothetical protein
MITFIVPAVLHGPPPDMMKSIRPMMIDVLMIAGQLTRWRDRFS